MGVVFLSSVHRQTKLVVMLFAAPTNGPDAGVGGLTVGMVLLSKESNKK